jgi:hypothetical protein
MPTFTVRLDRKPGAGPPKEGELTAGHIQHLLARAAALAAQAMNDSGEPDPDAADMAELLVTFTTPETIHGYQVQATRTLNRIRAAGRR